MKKKLVWIIITCVVFIAGSVVLFIPGMYSKFVSFGKNTVIIKSVYTFLKDNLGGPISTFRAAQGRDGFVALFAVLVLIFGLLPLLRVGLINDTTMDPIVVKQKAYGVYFNKDAITPSMVVVKEEKENGGK